MRCQSAERRHANQLDDLTQFWPGFRPLFSLDPFLGFFRDFSGIFPGFFRDFSGIIPG